MKKRAGLRWYWVLFMQGLIYFLCASACVFVPFLLDGWAERLLQYMLLPLIGGAAAYVATRKGLNNYAAWLLPPIVMPMPFFLFTGAPPYYVGGIFVCALAAIVGSSAGEVVNMRAKARKDPWRENT